MYTATEHWAPSVGFACLDKDSLTMWTLCVDRPWVAGFTDNTAFTCHSPSLLEFAVDTAWFLASEGSLQTLGLVGAMWGLVGAMWGLVGSL